MKSIKGDIQARTPQHKNHYIDNYIKSEILNE